MYDRQAIADRIYLARKSKSLKQREVCAALGIKQSSYSDVECGKRDLTVAELFTLSNLLGVSIPWLLGIDNMPDLTDSERQQVEIFIGYLISIRGKQ